MVCGAASDRFDVVAFHANRQRSLDRIDGYNKRAVAVARDEYALKTIECSASDSHTLTDFEEGMRRPGEMLLDQTPNCIDLIVRNRDPLASATDETEDSLDAQNTQALCPIRYKLGEHITTEQGQLHRPLAVTPAVNLGDEREKGCYPSLFEPLRHNFFVPGTSLQPIPIFGFRSSRFCSNKRNWLRQVPRQTADGHSFAL
jgi:hypothetical protein